MFNIYNNKTAFLNKKPKQVIWIIRIVLILIIISIIYSLNTKVYSNYRTKGYIFCKETCEIITMIPTNIEYEKVSINNQDKEISIIRKEVMIDEENMESFYKLYFKSSEKFLDKEIIDLNFYYNKESLFTKIKKKLF